ncbi:hypothetical protein DIPPA_00181 [Diplonema papillatum]|nr:hypothetical protein DIPPA_00181 [Diplonema papillatum]|eukprot:gene3812-5946_t
MSNPEASLLRMPAFPEAGSSAPRDDGPAAAGGPRSVQLYGSQEVEGSRAWHGPAVDRLLATTGRVPDWRDRIRKRGQAKQLGGDPRHAAPGAPAVLELHNSKSIADGDGGSPRLMSPTELARHRGASTAVYDTLPSHQRYSHADGGDARAQYRQRVDTAATLPTGPLSLDHVPGFKLNDEVKAMAVEQPAELSGKIGQVTGCEQRAGILHVLAAFGPPFGVQSLRTGNLANLTDMRRQYENGLESIAVD